jgi:two-component system sensor histidine kinase DesK
MESLSNIEGTQTEPQLYRVSGGNGGSGLQEIISASGISVRLWRLYADFWLVCLFFPILSLIQTPPAGTHLLIASLGLAIFTAIYFWVMWPHPLNKRARARFRLPTSLILTSSLAVLVLFLNIMYGSPFLWLFIGVSAIAGITLPFRSAAIMVFDLTLLTLGVSVGISGGIASANWLVIIPLVLLVRGLGLDMIGFVRLGDALRELHIAREELARQAVDEERLRMARDLHDLLGHTLSMITLKSELAGRLIEKDTHGAAQEIREVERAARQGLREMREAVAGYRQLNLRNELNGARQILEAAGIINTIEYPDRTLPSAIDTVLAWTVREGVTNVIRHGRAKHCQIRITSTEDYASAEICNDGYLQEGRSIARTGSGLSGLTERVSGQGGRVEAGPQSMAGGPGFRLWVEIPITAAPAAEVR